MINPLCAQLLMPLARDGALDNLFTALQGVAPDLALRGCQLRGRARHGLRGHAPAGDRPARPAGAPDRRCCRSACSSSTATG
jgi:hypothetical protein